MLFSSPLFLFIFLPLVLCVNFILPSVLRNFFLLIVSLLFYAWGEGIVVIVMMISITFNYFAGVGISVTCRATAKVILVLAVILNILFLGYYKYLNFFAAMVPLFKPLMGHSSSIILPLGISFYTFHAISYLVDIYRKGLSAERNPVNLGLYIAFFPQLIAGPIVRYSDVAEQLHERNVDLLRFYDGTIRFIRGLAKKTIIANTLGLIADRVFELNGHDIPTSIAWLGIICYSFQIYYDFSGYSDMAIGLAKMFGFNFRENFDHPYAATSMQDFWRRWHISLSTWFRDYVYIPLGGNRVGNVRTYVNLMVVFILTGLWHGAAWNFVIWGLFHGFFLLLERTQTFRVERLPPFAIRLYVVVVGMVGWVLFRSKSLE